MLHTVPIDITGELLSPLQLKLTLCASALFTTHHVQCQARPASQ